MDALMTIPVNRWACPCGRFIAESSIKEENFRDDSYYHGIRTEVTFTCSRCGVVQGEPLMVEVGVFVIDPDGAA